MVRLGGRRVRRVLGGLTVVAAGGGLLLGMGVQDGYPATRPQLLSGSAWLASRGVGQMTLLDGSSAEVAAQVRVAKPGDRFDVVQQGSIGYAVNRSSGTIRRVDGATFEVTPPASPMPGVRDGLSAFAGTDALYALDSLRGVLMSMDPQTLAPRGTSVPLATQISGQGAALDAAGRLWVLDTTTGDLVWIEQGRRHTRRGVAGPGAGRLVLADGAPVVVDAARRSAFLIDANDGSTRASVALDLRWADEVQLSGSPHHSRIYLAISRGVLNICDVAGGECANTVPVGQAGVADLGVPVETGGRLFIPDYASGKVWIIDLNQSRVVAQPRVLDPRTRFQLLTRDGVVFFNDPDSEHAGVIRLDGGVRPIAKYDPGNPNKNLTGNGKELTSKDRPPTTTPPATPPTTPTTPPATPPATPPTTPPPGAVQISMSRPSAHVGEDITFKVTTANGGRAPTQAQWSFGDGQGASGLQATHRWAAPQTYQVSVTATFADRHTATASVAVEITPVPVVAKSLTVTVTGNGTVTSQPAGISCPPACTATFAAATTVQLSATTAARSRFSGWGGACAGTTLSCAVTMSVDRSVTAGFQAIPPLPAPVQVSPADGAVFTNYPRNTTLTWQAVTGAARYLVEVQCDTCGSSPWTPWITTTVTGTSYSFVWVGDNTGRWRVTAIEPDGTRGQPSGFRTFRFNTAPTQLPAPVLISPANGAVFSHYPRTTTLRWQAVSGAARYHVEVQCDVCGPPGTMWVPWITQDVTGTSFTFNWVGAQSGRWRITAIAPNGTSGTPSNFRTFRYTV